MQRYPGASTVPSIRPLLSLSLLLAVYARDYRGSEPVVPSAAAGVSSIDPAAHALPSTLSEGDMCYLTGLPSSAPSTVPLSFCTMHGGGGGGVCCNPASDAQIGEYYAELVEVSDACAAHQTQAHLMLKQLFCFGCSPHQPRATDLPAFPSSNSSGAELGTVYLCPEVPAQVDPAAFDACGLLRPELRGDMCAGDNYVSRPTLPYESPPVLLPKHSCLYVLLPPDCRRSYPVSTTRMPRLPSGALPSWTTTTLVACHTSSRSLRSVCMYATPPTLPAWRGVSRSPGRLLGPGGRI
jgi:hypothetical protein